MAAGKRSHGGDAPVKAPAKGKPTSRNDGPGGDASERASKKAKTIPVKVTKPAEVDFPRGGGSGLTPLEHAQALREARAEMAKDDDLFRSSKAGADGKAPVRTKEQKRKDFRELKNDRKKKRAGAADKGTAKPRGGEGSKDRIEHLNYKRLAPGSRLLCSVLAVHPLALVLSLPNQLLGHVPITNVSPLLTQRLQAGADNMDSDDASVSDKSDEDDEDDDADQSGASPSSKARGGSALPELRDMYKIGDWVRASVVEVRSPNALRSAKKGFGREGGEYERESQRVELSIAPHAVNEGVNPEDVQKGSMLPVMIRSKEDHGFIVDAGIDGLEGFVTFAESPSKDLHLGQVLDCAVLSKAEHGRTFTGSLVLAKVKAAALASTSAPPSLSALVPGLRVSGLITATATDGLAVKLWGMFDATIDTLHLPLLPPGKKLEEIWKEGRRIDCRVLWDLGPMAAEGATGSLGVDHAPALSARKFGLSAAAHVLGLSPPAAGKAIEGEPAQLLQDAFPIGTIVSAAVTKTLPEWGLYCTLEETPLKAFVKISHVADEHVEKLPSQSGPYAVGTKHKARVIGHAPADQVLLLSLQPSVLARSFMRVSEVAVGSVLSGTIKSIRPNGTAIMVSLNGHVDGVVFPIHFADVPLKKPEKKYKEGQAVKVRVIAVDPSKNRISLTLKKSLITSDLPCITTFDEAKAGVVTQAVVSRILVAQNATGSGAPKGMLVDLFGQLRAYVPLSEATDNPHAAFPNATSLHSQFFEGKCVKVRITNIDRATGRISASIKQASAAYLARLNVDAVALGDKVEAQVAAVHQDVVVCELQPSRVRALISLAILAKQRDQTSDEVRDELEEGETLRDLVVVNKHAEKGLVILGPPGSKPSKGVSPVAAGAIVSGKVVERQREANVAKVLLPGGISGRLHAVDCADDFATSDSAPLPAIGDIVEVIVLRLRGAKRAEVSKRPSALAQARGESAAAPADASVETASALKVGNKYRGFVKAISDSGLFVDLGRNLTARVLIAELFDDYVKEWKGRFTVGQVVHGTVTSVDAGSKKVEMSLKKEPGSKSRKAKAATDKADKQQQGGKPLRMADLEKGQKVEGFIKSITEFGVFVQIEGSILSGLAHKSELSDNPSVNALQAFSVGDRVKAKVLDVSVAKQRISFGLKPSYFDADDFDENDEEEEEEEEEEEQEQEEGDDVDDGMADGGDAEEDEEDDDDHGDHLSALLDEDESMETSDAEGIDSDSQAGEDFLEDDDSDDDDVGDEAPAKVRPTATSASTSAVAPALDLAGLGWSAADEASADEGPDSDSDSDEEQRPAKRNGDKKRKSNGRVIDEDVTADLATKAPESSADFERLLLGSPNSSFLWIQFMSFQLQLGEIEKAREVARRALRVIAYREEQEKFNIWVALLNLENTYGSDDTLQSVFREAVQANDAKALHLRMVDILEQTGKVDKAEEMWRKTCKKFGFSSKVWIGFGNFYLRQGRAEDARALIPRSMQSLEKRKHVKTVTAFALSEYRLGEPERGRTIFEGLVDSYPKRLDLWIQYIDQEIKQRATSHVRELFSRVTSQRQSTKKAKSLFSKWHAFEKAHGDEKGEREVLERAKAFVASRAEQEGEEEEAQSGDEA